MTDQLELFDAPADQTEPARPSPASTPDTWLTLHLIRNGHLTENRTTRRAHIRTCPRCGQHVLRGLDGDTCAFDVTTDPHPLNPLGEALAHLENRRTYALHREARGYVLDPRDANHITHTPAGTRPREDILRDHRCTTGPPPPALTAPTTYAEAHPPLPPGSPPPF